MKQKTGRKLLSFLLTLAMVVGLMPGMSMTALADDTTGTQITADMTNLTAGTYYISSDTTINGELQVSAGTVVINLNGHTLSQESNNTTSVIYVSGGNLTVNNGTITGGDGGQNQRGGGFFVQGGNVTVNNVTISDNTASWGGGVYMYAGSFTMNNSHIDGNHSVTDGNGWHDAGGVYLDGGTFTMNGGSIKNNTVTEGKKNGLVMANSNAVVRLSGDAFIYDNTDNDGQENLWADSLFEGASQIYVTGELGLNAKLGIRSNLNQVFTKSENTDYNDPTKFVSDNSDYRVGKNDAGQLMLVESTTQLITAANVTAAYGDTDKSVSATTDGDGTISYAVKDGSKDYIDVNSSTGALTIKAVPADGKAYVTVTASATSNYSEATKDVTVTIGKATATIGHEDKSTTYSSDGISIPIEGMFTIPTGAGEPTYSVTNGTGEGSYENGKLTVTKCGTFTVTVNTAESSTHVAGNASATLTVNKSNAVPATITANNSTYDGTEKLLVTVTGTATGGEMQYALGTATEANEPYTTSIPSKTDAGTYYVWYKAVADDSGNYTDSEPKCVAAAISQGAAAPTAPTSDKLTYNGANQALLKAGSVPEGCKMLYALGKDATTAPTDGWSTDVPTGKDAGTYYAWYKIDGGANYNDVAPVCISVEVAKAIGVPTDAQKPAAKTGLVANGQAQALLTAPTSLPEGYAKIQYSTDGGKTWSDTIPTGTVAGAYAVSVKYVGDANHNDIDGGSISVTVAAPEPEPEPQPAANPSGIPILTITSAGSDALNFALTNASGVDGFDLFFRICDGKEDYPLYASVTGTSYTVAGLKTGRSYKGYARAWVMKNGAKQYVLEASPTAHCFTNNGTNKETNPADIKLKTPSLTVRLGKSKAIKASVLKVKKGALATHVAKLRYFSDNPAVATVNAKGKVKGVGAGSCNVYVLTTNGIWKTVPVTVDASPTRVKLTKVKRSMAIGETQALGAKVVLNPKGAITTLTWTSSNEAVATVDPNGNVTAKAKGKATITVTAANGKKAKVTIRVK